MSLDSPEAIRSPNRKAGGIPKNGTQVIERFTYTIESHLHCCKENDKGLQRTRWYHSHALVGSYDPLRHNHLPQEQIHDTGSRETRVTH